MYNKWVALFSQTGSEILNITNNLKVDPYKIITNQQDISKINKQLLEKYKDKIIYLQKKPTEEEYIKVLEGADIITLHGWLRIIPANICNKYKIYNLHPGLITKYPILKGFNPQEKAFNLKLPTAGCVIHEVVPEVDSGKILEYSEFDITNNTLDEVYTKLHDSATLLWTKFLQGKVK